jgi:L-amino acid N-acyltransferase YncA
MPSADLLVRSASLDDLEMVERIYRHYVDASVSTFEEAAPDRAEWTRRFGEVTGRGLPFLVAEAQRLEARSLVVGYALAAPWRSRPAYRHTVEESVYVDPSAVGHGVGHALLDDLLRRCALANVREVVAVIVDTGATGDTASLALHRRCGFVVAGRLAGVGHKHDRWLDTILMQRSLARPRHPISYERVSG